MKYDIAIIGTGPAGSSTALNLPNHFKVALFEKDKYAGKNNVCAGAIDKKEIDKIINLPSKIIEKKLKRCNIFLNGKLIQKNKDNIITIRRAILDNYLAKKAEKKGVDLFLNTEIIKIEKQKKGWKLFSKNKIFNSKIIVFADGPLSKLRQEFGLGFRPNQNNSYIAMIREFSCKNASSRYEFYYNRSIQLGHGWLIPKKHMLSVGVGLLQKYNQQFLIEKLLDNIFDSYIKGSFNVGVMIRERVALIPCQIAKNIYEKDGLLVVGDAAGLVSPCFGEGIRYAMLSGALAAKCIENNLDYGKEIKKQKCFKNLKNEEKIMKFFKCFPWFYNIYFTKIIKSKLYTHLSSSLLWLLKKIKKDTFN